MKKSVFIMISVIAATAILILGAGSSLADKKVEWNFVSMLMNTHPVVTNAVIPVFEKFKKESGGRFEIAIYNPGTLVPTPELHRAIQRGAADIGVFGPSRFPNEFPITTLGDYPFLFRGSRAASFSMAELFTSNQQIQQEYNKMKVLGFTSSTPFDIVSIEPIRTLEDIKGKRFGVMESASVQIVQLLGGVPVLLNPTDLYVSLQRGMVDAVVAPIPTYRSIKICEVAKYIIKCDIKCCITPETASLNSYNKLPDDIKAIVSEISLKANTALCSNWVEIFTEKDLQWLIENNGVQIIEIAPEEIERWRTAVKPMYDEWIRLAKKNGVKNPEAILAELRSHAEKYNKIENQIAETAKYKDVLGDLYVNYKEN